MPTDRAPAVPGCCSLFIYIQVFWAWWDWALEEGREVLIKVEENFQIQYLRHQTLLLIQQHFQQCWFQPPALPELCSWQLWYPPASFYPFFLPCYQRLKFLLRDREEAKLCRCRRCVLPCFCTEIKECIKPLLHAPSPAPVASGRC